MAKKFIEQKKWTIPSDWEEGRDGYLFVCLCIPNSRQWRGIFAGLISGMAYGRNWNKLTGTIKSVQGIARGIFETMGAANCDDIVTALNCLCDALSGIESKGETAGQAIERPFFDGTVQVGEGEQFPEQEQYFIAKCSVANGIFDTVRGTVSWLVDNNGDLIKGLFGGITSGLIVGILTLGPVGWTITLSATALALIGGYILTTSLTYSDVRSALDSVHQEAVLALFNAADAKTAKQNFIEEVKLGSPTISAPEALFFEYLMPADMLNQLFEPRDDVAEYISPSPIDCGGAVLEIWSFVASVEGWTFRDDSDPSCSASQSYDSINEAIENELIVASLPHVRAEAVNISPVVSHAISPGASIQVDYGPPSDVPNGHGLQIRAMYSDMTEEETAFLPFFSAGTAILTLTQSKTVIGVEVEVARSTSGTASGTTSQQDILEVRLIGL